MTTDSAMAVVMLQFTRRNWGYLMFPTWLLPCWTTEGHAGLGMAWFCCSMESEPVLQCLQILFGMSLRQLCPSVWDALPGKLQVMQVKLPVV